MTDYSLTDKQKEMLRSVLTGIDDKTISPDWTGVQSNTIRGVNKIVYIAGFENRDIWNESWKDVKEADLEDFVDHGFLRSKGPGKYTLAVQKIRDAVENDFQNRGNAMQPNQGNLLNLSPIFNPPSQDDQYVVDVFMIMPFADEFTPIYEHHIKPVVEGMGYTIKRGDEDIFSHDGIMDEIWSLTYNCKFLIADCTGKNPNVFYEFGIADVIGRPVIPITQNVQDVPFDIRHRRFIEYQDNSAGLHKLKTELQKAINKIMTRD